MSDFPEVTPSVIARYDMPGPRYTSYPPVPYWTRTFRHEEYAQRLRDASRSDAPLSLYIHLPFCKRLCTFCGCNVVVARDHQKADVYLEHLDREMALAAELLGARREVAQLHLGGGTPTFLNEEQLARLWESVRRNFTPAADAELAVEVNPVVTSPGQIALLRRLGFNRLSIGVQDFDPAVQAAIGRFQTFEVTRDLVLEARRLGFAGINMDLIYGLPRQALDSWRQTLERVRELRPDRAAVYSFAYVPEVRPHQRRIAADSIPRGAPKLELFKTAYESLTAAGYRPIGMDHFALPDDELARAQERRTLWRNFQGYTVKAASDVVAFGITAISEIQGAYAQNVKPLADYYASVASGRFATERGWVMSRDDQRRRDVITQLMCNFWTDLGPGGADGFAEELERLREYEDEGLVRISGSEVELTPVGRIFVRNVAMVFDAFLDAGSQPRRFSATV